MEKHRALILFVAFVSLPFLSTPVAAETLRHSTQADFDSGTYTNTGWYVTGHVGLISEQTSGAYESGAKDAGFASWNEMRWTEGSPYGEGLPDNGQSETVAGGVDMAGNSYLIHMNEASWGGSSYDVKDSSGSGNMHFTSYNGANTVAGCIFDRCGSFDGGDDYVFMDDPITKSNPAFDSAFTDRTVELWFKANALSGTQFIYEEGGNVNGMAIYLDGGSLYIGAWAESLAWDGQWLSTTTDTSRWHHVALVFDGSSELTFYYDGKKISSAAAPTTMYDHSGDDSIAVMIDSSKMHTGDVNSGPKYYYSGLIDEFAVYDRVLSEPEILSRYKRGALNLEAAVRGCDDPVCSGESYSSLYKKSPITLNISNSRYFQYRFSFSSIDSSLTPELKEVQVDYTSLNSAPAKPALSSPSNGAVVGGRDVTFQYSSSDPDGDAITYRIYLDRTAGFEPAGSNLIYEGASTARQHTVPSYGTYYWKVRASDGRADSEISAEWSFTSQEDVTPPAISNERISQYPVANDIITVSAEITDSSAITAWVNVKSVSASNNYSMSLDSGNTWKSVFTIPAAGSYQFKVYAKDSFNNQNSQRGWIAFTVQETSPCDNDGTCELSSGETQANCPGDCCAGNETKPCGSNIGACEEGWRVCAGGQWGECSGGVQPANEVCNGIDDDCDGQVDENVVCACESGDTRDCGSDVGECVFGVSVCKDGAWSECKSGVSPSEETCDGKDNNCDGETDEGCECRTGEEKDCGSNIGACESGKQQCVNGKWGECAGGVRARPEICDNNFDDDCDDEVNNGCFSCEDGAMNGDEEGVDCGGSCPNSCFDFPWWLLILVGFLMLALGVYIMLPPKEERPLEEEEMEI